MTLGLPTTEPADRGAVAVTGASGFVGSACVRALAGRGWPVIGLCRNPHAQPALARVDWRPYSVTRPLDPAVLRGAGAVIHCAYAPHVPGGPDVVTVNVDAAAALHAASRALNAARFVFVSSLSAIQEGTSKYGRQKRAIEALCDPGRDLVIRPGLVLGYGGFAQRLATEVSTRRVVPLVGNGHQPVYALGIDELCDTLASAVTQRVVGRFSLAAPDPITLRALAEGIAAAAGVHPWFLPIPEWPVRAAARAAEWLGLPFPVSTEQVEGLSHLKRHDVSADLEALGLVPRPIGETLARLRLP